MGKYRMESNEWLWKIWNIPLMHEVSISILDAMLKQSNHRRILVFLEFHDGKSIPELTETKYGCPVFGAFYSRSFPCVTGMLF